jgi:hypothetical protein
MKSIVRKWMTIATLSVAAVTVASAAGATTLTFGASDPYFIGYIHTGEPSSEALEATYINHLIDVAAGGTATVDGHTYYRDNSSFDCSACPDALSASANTSAENPGTTNVDVTGYTYLLAKYDGPNAGDLLWYVAGLTSVTFPDKWGPADKSYGISHYALFNLSDGPTEGPGDGPSEGPTEGPGDGPTEGPGDGPSEGPAPEPASLLLFGSALSAFAYRMRRATR